MSDYVIVGINPELMLHDGPDGDEGLARWYGQIAGPFETFDEADDAFLRLDPPDGVVLCIWSASEQLLYTKEKL